MNEPGNDVASPSRLPASIVELARSVALQSDLEEKDCEGPGSAGLDESKREKLKLFLRQNRELQKKLKEKLKDVSLAKKQNENQQVNALRCFLSRG